MKLQVDNIETQNNNLANNMMNPNTIARPIGEQILNLSIQMLNSGIQAFNMGIKKSFNKENFYPITFNFAISAFLITYLISSSQHILLGKLSIKINKSIS